MPHTLKAVEEERECKEALESDLNCHWPSSHCRDQRLCLQVPSGVWRCEVCEAEEIQRAGEDDCRDTVQGRAIPCDLRAVDGEMWGDGAVEALFDEDVDGFALRGGTGRCESDKRY
jgi:hypothetical protein